MKATTLLAASLAVLPSLVASHGGHVPGAPRFWGRRGLQDLESRDVVRRHRRSIEKPFNRRATATSDQTPNRVEARQAANTAGQCGSGYGSCAAGYCCSPAGWCGNTEDYCAAPNCQFNYGPGCDTNQVPPGPATSNVPRPQIGSVPYGGAGIYDCTVTGSLALTFDDGPYIYTESILNILEKYNVTATFFITGNNLGKGQIDNAAYPWASLIQRMYSAGHQIASHTWGHQDLGSSAAGQGQDVLTQQQRLDQMYNNEIAFNNILGFFPTYMRPPYSDCDAASGCESDLANLGYHITYFDLDTEDYLMNTPSLIQNSMNFFEGNISSTSPSTGNWLVIGHDIDNQTASVLVEYMITTALAAGWNLMTVGDCLGDPPSNWYRTLGGGSVFTSTASAAASSTTSGASSTPTAASPDGTCGGSTGYFCTGTSYGNCCSASGWCGSSSAYCGTGCQSGFGLCGDQTLSSTSTSTSALPSSTVISSDGTCGGTNGYTCQGSTFGNCCSPAGWCGSTSAYCGTGCQSQFGSCGSNTASGTATSTSTAPSSTSTLEVSSNGSCGGTTGFTCQGSTFGNCCSPAGWCGSTSAYCGTGCQLAYGSCSTTTSSTVAASSSASSSASSAPSSSSSSSSSDQSASSSSADPTSSTSSADVSSSSSTANPPTTSSSGTSSSTPLTTSTTTGTSGGGGGSTSSTSTTRTTSTKKGGPSSKTSSASSTPSPSISRNGKCGAAENQTCAGSVKGNCCGSANTCGSGIECGTGCQTQFSRPGSCL